MKMTGSRFNPTLGYLANQAITINRACGRRTWVEKDWGDKGELDLRLIDRREQWPKTAGKKQMRCHCHSSPKETRAMKFSSTTWSTMVVVLVGFLASSAFGGEPTAPIQVGASFNLNGRKGTVTKLDSLPLVENKSVKGFKFDSHKNPKLKELREHYNLDEIVSPGKDEFDRQVLLLDWVNHQFKKFGRPTANPRGAVEILRDIEAGHTFFCAQYADVLVSAAASMGSRCRRVIGRPPRPATTV